MCNFFLHNDNKCAIMVTCVPKNTIRKDDFMIFTDVGFRQSCSYDNGFYCAETNFYGITLEGVKISVINIKETTNKMIYNINDTLTTKELKQIKSLYEGKNIKSPKKVKVKKRKDIYGK